MKLQAAPAVVIVQTAAFAFHHIAYDGARDRCLVGGDCTGWQRLVSLPRGGRLQHRHGIIGGSADHNTRALACCASGTIFAASSRVPTIARRDGLGLLTPEWAHARLHRPSALAIRPSDGLLLVSDPHVFRISGVSRDTGRVHTVAGSGRREHVDGLGTRAGFTFPDGLCCDARGIAYVTDLTRVRRMTSDGLVSTVVGLCGWDPLGPSGTYHASACRSATFMRLRAICVDAERGSVYAADGECVFELVPLQPATVVAALSADARLAHWPPELLALVVSYSPTVVVSARTVVGGESPHGSRRAHSFEDITGMAFVPSRRSLTRRVAASVHPSDAIADREPKPDAGGPAGRPPALYVCDGGRVVCIALAGFPT